jgi:hypothetical protein
MANILHWIGVGLGLLVLAVGIRGFLGGLTLKPSDPSTRVANSWLNRWRP